MLNLRCNMVVIDRWQQVAAIRFQYGFATVVTGIFIQQYPMLQVKN